MGRALVIGVHFVRSARAGRPIRWYVYAWRGGPQVYRSEERRKPRLTHDVIRAIADALDARAPKEPDNLRSVMRDWRSANPDRPSSPEWDRLADTTKKVWGNALDLIEAKWGDVPLAVFNDPRMKARIVKWRDSRASTPRSADIGVTVLRALLRFGELRGKVHINAASGIPSIYRGGDRAEIIWTEDEIAAFCVKASELGLDHAADGLRLAATTGLRRDDLVSLTWDHVSAFGIRKMAKKRSRGKRRFANVPTLPALYELLDELRGRHRASGVQTVLVDAKGNSWTPDRLTKAVAKVRDAV